MDHPNEQPNGQEKQLQFSVTEEEARLMFRGLGKLPFEEVYELVGKLNRQANEQYVAPPAKGGGFPPSTDS